jgi:2,4-dienoyl-CoA reductase-like NADH-dependent reductase (Old Yellow Enzyme family)
MTPYSKVAQFKDVSALRSYLEELGLELPIDDVILSRSEATPLGQPLQIGPIRVGNRWCIHPMEGWDAKPDGSPSDLTLRRWRRFGQSGAKWIWGGEAAAVVASGRANPRQSLATPENRAGLEQLLRELETAHSERFGNSDDLLVGLQLTHSGRFCRPRSDRLEPQIAYHHPLLDEKFGIEADDDSVVLQDGALEELIDQFVISAGVAAEVGFRFVDVKACHGYLLHELLGAHTRPGPFGGDFSGRTHLLTEIIRRIRSEYPALLVGVRISALDSVPYGSDTGPGRPLEHAHLLPYRYGFGVLASDPLKPDLRETIELLQLLRELGVAMVNVSCGSPYYTPHLQRPAIFPPSDGYLPPEDPLCGVARQIHATRQCKEAVPELPLVGSGYSYLQDYLPHVAQAVVRRGWVDAVGIGRMALAYPQLPADTLAGKELARKKICRTFSDCTTAPRNGIVSGCFPLDAHYRQMNEAEQLKAVKKKTNEDS